MKIAFILSRCSNLGPFIVARDIANNIYDKAEVDVFYLKASDEKLTFKTACSKIDFFKRIDFANYDIVHSHGFVADAYIHFHRKHVTCKLLTTIHQRIAPDYAMKYNFIVGHVFEKIWCHFIRKSHLVITLTNELKSYYQKRLKACPISYIYNGIDVSHQAQAIPETELKQITVLKKKYKLIGISARLNFLKGVDQVIEFLSHKPDFALVIIGDGEKRRELEVQAKKLNVSDRCLFLGYKNNALSYFNHFDVYAMSSRSEGFGLCVIEAASQKVPVVCSDLPVYREIFNNEEVVRFELENILSIVEAFEKAIEKKQILSEKIYQKYKNCFTAEIMANNYLKEYKRLLQK